MTPAPRDDRWQHLLTAAARLQDAGPPRELLDSALEVFAGSIDPVEDFEGYAVRRFLLALREALQESC